MTTTGLKLYELTDVYQALQQKVLEGEDGWEAALAGIDELFQNKAQNVAKVVRTLEAETQAFIDEAKRLTAHARARAEAAERLKGYLAQEMAAMGVEHVKGLVDLRLQASPPSVTVDETQLPQVWQKAVLEMPRDMVPEEMVGAIKSTTPLKAELLKLHREGKELPPGVTIETGRKHLVLR